MRRALLLLLASIVFTGCPEDRVRVLQPPVITEPSAGTNVLSVTVTPPSVTLPVGGTATLVATVVAEAGVSNRTVSWSSSNPVIAVVDGNGVVAAHAAGTTTITASSNASPAVRGAAAVTVAAQGL